MRDGFSEQEIESYRRDGFLVVEELLSAAELAQWRDAADMAVAEDLVRQPDGSNPQVYTQRMNLRRVSAAVNDLVADPRVGKLAAELEGVDAIRLYLDQVLVKEPYGSPTQFHLDLPWWSFDASQACTIWIALDDSTVENGCLYFVPGSHQLELPYRSDLGANLGAIFAAHPEIQRAPVPGPLRAGGCTFHNARTIHGAGANMTSGRRRAYTVAFMPDGAPFNGTRDVRSLGVDYLDSLDIGDLLQNDELNPVVYARADAAAPAH